MRPTRTGIIICTGLRIKGGCQLWGARYARLGVTSGRYGAEQSALPPEYRELIEHTLPQHPHPRDAEAR